LILLFFDFQLVSFKVGKKNGNFQLLQKLSEQGRN
jgi:hypothetical protein